MKVSQDNLTFLVVL